VTALVFVANRGVRGADVGPLGRRADRRAADARLEANRLPVAV
jgi:hypothetical protein